MRAGIDVKDVTRASVEQAAATRSLAIDSKRDGEIMKIITVVTLFYLPAMFVTVSSLSISLINGQRVQLMTRDAPGSVRDGNILLEF